MLYFHEQKSNKVSKFDLQHKYENLQTETCIRNMIKYSLLCWVSYL